MKPGIFEIETSRWPASKREYAYINRLGRVGFCTGPRAFAVALVDQTIELNHTHERGLIDVASGVILFTRKADETLLFNKSAIVDWLSRMGHPFVIGKWGNVLLVHSAPSATQTREATHDLP